MKIQHRFLTTSACVLLSLGSLSSAVAHDREDEVIALKAHLTGPAEVPHGDPDGSGEATILIDLINGKLSFKIQVADIAPAIASHIHKASAGVAGPVVIPLVAPTGGESEGTVDVAQPLLLAILLHPEEYYVNVHNTEFPPGAVRGQLQLMAEDDIEDLLDELADDLEEKFETNLTGPAEVPDGDPDGTGRAKIKIDLEDGTLEFKLQVSNIKPAAAAHIHRAPAGVAGPVVIPLVAPTDGKSRGKVSVDPALLLEILLNPAGFYVNVHNAEFPAGAVRGQLASEEEDDE